MSKINIINEDNIVIDYFIKEKQYRITLFEDFHFCEETYLSKETFEKIIDRINEVPN